MHPTMRFVELKTQEQLDMRTLHRSRDQLVAERTALINRFDDRIGSKALRDNVQYLPPQPGQLWS